MKTITALVVAAACFFFAGFHFGGGNESFLDWFLFSGGILIGAIATFHAWYKREGFAISTRNLPRTTYRVLWRGLLRSSFCGMERPAVLVNTDGSNPRFALLDGSLDSDTEFVKIERDPDGDTVATRAPWPAAAEAAQPA